MRHFRKFSSYVMKCFEVLEACRQLKIHLKKSNKTFTWLFNIWRMWCSYDEAVVIDRFIVSCWSSLTVTVTCVTNYRWNDVELRLGSASVDFKGRKKQHGLFFWEDTVGILHGRFIWKDEPKIISFIIRFFLNINNSQTFQDNFHPQ